MNKLTILGSALLASVSITACGGGGSDTGSTSKVKTTSAPATPSTNTTTPPATSTPPANDNTGTLVIDNGRGTTNNQDTERD